MMPALFRRGRHNIGGSALFSLVESDKPPSPSESHYSKGGMTPQCLPSVLRQMIRQKRLAKLASPRGWFSSIGGFLLRAPGALISLAVSGEINLVGGQEEDEDGMLVVCACVDAAAARMRAIGRVLPLRCAQEAAKGERGTAADIQVVMSVLEERGEIMRFIVGGSDDVHVKVSSSTGTKAQVLIPQTPNPKPQKFQPKLVATKGAGSFQSSTHTLDPKSETPNPRPKVRNPKSETLGAGTLQPSTQALDPKSETLNPKVSIDLGPWT
jgi:hypothetical protein